MTVLLLQYKNTDVPSTCSNMWSYKVLTASKTESEIHIIGVITLTANQKY